MDRDQSFTNNLHADLIIFIIEISGVYINRWTDRNPYKGDVISHAKTIFKV
jgi:hypothetical protein